MAPPRPAPTHRPAAGTRPTPRQGPLPVTWTLSCQAARPAAAGPLVEGVGLLVVVADLHALPPGAVDRVSVRRLARRCRAGPRLGRPRRAAGELVQQREQDLGGG